MTDFSDPSGASLRLSDAERERAVAALQSHAAQGRLSDAELQSRSAAARAAVTRGDLAPLFGDLPGALRLDDAPTVSSSAAPEEHRPAGRWGLLIVSVMPFVAVILFFVTGMAWGYQYSWLWFLLIPLAGAIVYGVGDGGGRRR